MCLALGKQRSDAGEARTRGPSVTSQAIYKWATALPSSSSSSSSRSSSRSGGTTTTTTTTTTTKKVVSSNK